MAKPAGSKSTVPKTLAELSALLGGRNDIPVQVSKGWLESAKLIFGGGESAETDTDSDDEGEAPEKKTGVRLEE